jgi:hypothetical protein
MWVSATFVYLVPAVVITIQLLSPPTTHPAEHTQAALPGIAALPAEVEVV